VAAQIESPEAEKLEQEFEQRLKLNPVEAHRATFVVLALSKGWRHARIARYLGVTRHRIGQRAERYQQYAASGEFPALTGFLNGNTPAPTSESEVHVEFRPEDWQDLTFAVGLIDRLCTD
jgi:hypothetical protein